MAELLDHIDGPDDLKELGEDELQQLAQEVREYIIDTVGEIGGHFGANLGTCELAVALHSVLDSPRDKILWDVGHQAYPHKVLTGRRAELPTIRQYGGLAPFCSREESPHDIMGAGHASTAASYAVGIKEAMRKRREFGITGEGDEPEGRVVAVVGDGAMTGGVNFEALLNAGGLETPVVIVLNDNGMSISPNVGALSRYFNRLRLNPRGWQAREAVEAGLTQAARRHRRAHRAARPAAEGVDQGVLGARPVLRGARPRLRRRDRRPRREGAAPCAEPGARRQPPGGRAHQDGEGQGLRARRGGRPRGHGEVARGQAGQRGERRSPRRPRVRRAAADPAAVHGGVRPGARRRGAARPARDRHHRRDGGRHRPVASSRASCPTTTTTSASPSSTPCCSRPGWRSRA